MSNERFFYHSFPRRPSVNGLSILRSIIERGLLLTPEKFEFREPLDDGSSSAPASIFQKRICFTELSPNELPAHSKLFGTFALEFDINTLRAMGAIPVFYVPLHFKADGHEGLA